MTARYIPTNSSIIVVLPAAESVGGLAGGAACGDGCSAGWNASVCEEIIIAASIIFVIVIIVLGAALFLKEFSAEH